MTNERSNDASMPRRKFLKLSAATVGGLGAAPAADLESKAAAVAPSQHEASGSHDQRAFNSPYTEESLNRIAFPLGGIGAGMICLEGTGALSHVSLRNRPEVFNEPCVFVAVCVKGAGKGSRKGNVARILEGPVPQWKLFGTPGTG